MLASTIQFSKYGQEHQPQTTTYQQKHPQPGKQHTQKQTPTPAVWCEPAPATQPTVTDWSVTLEETVHNLHGGSGPIPQDPTARLGLSLHHHPRSTLTSEQY